MELESSPSVHTALPLLCSYSPHEPLRPPRLPPPATMGVMAMSSATVAATVTRTAATRVLRTTRAAAVPRARHALASFPQRTPSEVAVGGAGYHKLAVTRVVAAAATNTAIRRALRTSRTTTRAAAVPGPRARPALVFPQPQHASYSSSAEVAGSHRLAVFRVVAAAAAATAARRSLVAAAAADGSMPAASTESTAVSEPIADAEPNAASETISTSEPTVASPETPASPEPAAPAEPASTSEPAAATEIAAKPAADGPVCIVTGASRGIGAAIALALGSQGGASWAVFSLGSLST